MLLNIVNSSMVWIFGGVLFLVIMALAFEEKHHAKKSIITGMGAVVCLLLGELLHVFPHEAEGGGHVPFYIEFIDWQVITIILGSSLFVEVTSRSGIFSWLALKLTKATKGDTLKLLWTYSLLTVVFSAFLNNVTAMIIVGSLTVISLKQLEQKNLILGFLLTEGLLTNIGGMLTLISSVPNIILGQAAGISFITFLEEAAPFVVVATAITVLLASRTFGIRSLKTAEEKRVAANKVALFNENEQIDSRGFFLTSWVALVAFILLLAGVDLIPFLANLKIGFVAMAFGVLVLLREYKNPQTVYSKLDWDLMLFFCFLFIIIGTMEHAGVLDFIGHALLIPLEWGEVAGNLALLTSSALASSVTDNIPLAAVLATPLANAEAIGESTWWAVIFGCNLGGNITPIGSASTIVAVTIMHNAGIAMSFVDFVKKAILFALIQLVLAAIYVGLIL